MSEATPGSPLWEPTRERIAQANITRYQEFLRSKRGLDFPDYESLWRWSVDDLETFWGSIWEYFGLHVVSSYEQVLADESMPGAQWFPGARLNFAQYVLDQGDPQAVAVVGTDESGAIRTWIRATLREQVASLAAWLRRARIGPGDVVVGYIPNIGEAVVAFLAVASVGAVWSSVGQEYAPAAVVDRFAQLEPKILIAADGYHFNGKWHGRLDAVAEVLAGLPSVRHAILVERHDLVPNGSGWQSWDDTLAEPAEVESLAVPFNHPLWVLFSSGTTGLPKGLVHGHGGILLETLKQMVLHWDLGKDDRLFWYTSPSWVMWNLQLSTLACGGSIVCYGGSPTYPDPSTLWKLVSDLEVTFFGTSPGYLQVSENAGVRPAVDFELSGLRSMGSTGSPLSPHSHRWARDQVGFIPLWSMSGGTDIAGAFVGGAPIVPIWPGELSAPCLGVALAAWDEDGHPVADEVGELVVHRPMPSMPVYFWNDPDGSRYADAYYSTYPGAWRQGDWITITARGSVIIHGRSDSTLNRNGVRIGSADIYAAVATIPEVAEALVIGAEQGDGTYWMPLFVVLSDGQELDDTLIDLIRTRIRDLVSPRHVPDEVIAVPGIPHTQTGKKLEVPVKRLLQGAPLAKVVNLDTVDNPELLIEYAAIAASHGKM
ncbi:acetoacetyl-CoA synthetase [Candidatus Protofrankia californiensis]|uniref:Acetoacetyl-CoA synthetase n=1 Tax=Candidatus Protofrankia californiensis TaxID=1839754 RepID=A0A1C3NTE8_9ACTN|nr:acetoacetyl-CoA synthetase [Candidatus Protofrankia californiensis]